MRNIPLLCKERKSSGIYIVTQKGQAILFFIPYPFFVSGREDRDVYILQNASFYRERTDGDTIK